MVSSQTIEFPQSATVNHVLSYPIVKDMVHYAIDVNVVGRTGKSVTIWWYNTFAKPFAPLLDFVPYQYATPYAKKLDGLSDTVLAKVDDRLPVIQKPTGEVYSETKSLVSYPLTAARERYHSVYDNYRHVHDRELAKIGDRTRLNRVKAAASATLIFVSDTLTAASKWMTTKSDKATSGASQPTQSAAEKAEEIKETTEEAVKDTKKEVQEVANNANKDVQEKAKKTKDKAKKAQDKAKEKTEELPKLADEKAAQS